MGRYLIRQGWDVAVTAEYAQASEFSVLWNSGASSSTSSGRAFIYRVTMYIRCIEPVCVSAPGLLRLLRGGWGGGLPH